ncbi:hypothetical protein F6Q07_00340 [Pectobacterium parmentieri]|uniref:Uncharacterized protein n=1 Tax=Pectobacterium parmentieri TaxID=1905730 RepID=A0ABS0RYU6_PECPM|nr:hypothetical protein C5E26_07220 [Pectobacterium parmentieri]AYH05207.1 hypothetical protein C5E25_07500 [Pectobacterium parmentieri]AYH14028.1 hypothetical protein C5E23_07475 [Pectobacterium parmentieri]AYH22732.1 hypothetical protein C5E21_07480 [Pectobacterium parmentieri]AYH26980.1 hypothetical protein C5E20_07470 [Pectobacterium parmentieri]
MPSSVNQSAAAQKASLQRHYTISTENACSPMWLLGVFFDPAHIFTNLVSKKITQIQDKEGCHFP